MALNISAVAVAILLVFEMFFLMKSAQHKKKKLIKGWNKVTGVVTDSSQSYDKMARKTLINLTIETPDERVVKAKVGTLCDYEIGEEVELMELNGVHRFLGNDRLDKMAKKERLIGTIPILVVIVLGIALSAMFW